MDGLIKITPHDNVIVDTENSKMFKKPGFPALWQHFTNKFVYCLCVAFNFNLNPNQF